MTMPPPRILPHAAQELPAPRGIGVLLNNSSSYALAADGFVTSTSLAGRGCISSSTHHIVSINSRYYWVSISEERETRLLHPVSKIQDIFIAKINGF